MKKKLFSAILALILILSMAVTVSAATDEFVYDAARLVSQREEAALSARLEQLSDTYGAQIVVMTLDSINGHDVDILVEGVYDDMGLGYGSDYDGVLLLVCMDVREYRILRNGYPGEAIDEYDIENISDAIVDDLSNGDYADAFNTFADQCEYYLDGYVNGFPFDFGTCLVIALVLGIAVGVITVSVMKSQLKTVRAQNRAHEYLKSGSMRVNIQRDIFLYRNVRRTRRESSSSSGRSSGRSSGGSSRSRGGGSF